MLWSALADALVLTHFTFTGFVLLGSFLTWRWPWLRFVHLPALAWGVWVEVSHSICPLTPLENRLRHLGGEAGYSGGFLAHYVGRILYPVGLTAQMQWILAGLLILINVIAYAGLWQRLKRARLSTPSP
jgi:uncharacterized membrane protein YhhN